MVGGVLTVGDHPFAANQLGVGKDSGTFRNDILLSDADELLQARTDAEVDFHQPVVRRIFIGQHVDVIVKAGHNAVPVTEIGGHLHKAAVFLVQVFHKHPVAVVRPVLIDDEPLLLLVGGGGVEALRIAFV